MRSNSKIVTSKITRRFVFVAKRTRRSNSPKRFRSSKTVTNIDVVLQGQRGNSSVRSAIDRLAKILEKRNDAGDELLRFLSREKGFRSEQVWNSCVFHCCTPLYSPNVVRI